MGIDTSPAAQPGEFAGDWLVPRAGGPVRATVRLPGSKSMTNRALILAALADGPTLISGPLVSRDTQLMAAALGVLGCPITQSPGSWQVHPPGQAAEPGHAAAADRPASPGEATQPIEIDVGNAGTVLRFVPPVAALSWEDVSFRGDSRVAKRPVEPLLNALRHLGAQIDADGPAKALFVVRGRGGMPGGSVTLDASASSQLISGLVLAAPRFAAGINVTHHGPPVPSAPHIEMTVRMLRDRGVSVATNDDAGTRPGAGPGNGGATSAQDLVRKTWRVPHGPIAGGRIEIEPDLSNAVPFVAAAMATGGDVTIAGWPTESIQPAGRIMQLLTSMGATVVQTADGLRLTGPGAIRGINADLSEVGELTPVLTALAALASAPSEFTGIGHLRTHESDRLAALAGEIGKLGGDVTELPDGLAIRPRPLRADGVVFDSHDDHRLVMAAAVLGLVTGGLRVANAATVGKTFPGFTTLWAQIVASAG